MTPPLPPPTRTFAPASLASSTHSTSRSASFSEIKVPTKVLSSCGSPTTIRLTACSMSESGSTMHAAFPPNSRTTFLAPASDLSWYPTCREPVKLRSRNHGVLAPHAWLRALVVKPGKPRREKTEPAPEPDFDPSPPDPWDP